jgi:hypothetical protein
LSKKQHLTGLRCTTDARGGCSGRRAVTFSETSKGNVVDTIEDIAVLAGLLVFSSLSLAVIVLMY